MGCGNTNLKEGTIMKIEIETIKDSEDYIHYLIETASQWWLILFNIRKKSFITLKLENEMLESDCESVLSSDGLYCSGGMEKYNHIKTSKKTNKVYFNTKSALAVSLAVMKDSRRKHAFIGVNGNMLCALGGYKTKNDILSSCEVYNIKKNTWQVIESMNYARACAAACSFQERVVFIFGEAKNNSGISLIIESRDFSKVKEPWTVVSYTTDSSQIDPEKLWCTQINTDEIIIFDKENITIFNAIKSQLCTEKQSNTQEKYLPDKRGQIKEYEGEVFMILETRGDVGIYSLNDKKWTFQPHILLDL